ncbi:tyrosine-type recombinase/integrase [Amycolatopsis sp. VS8301801F10]|uniref:tyrosine-type recombinase/integrase n=1 Tax=unclassified Amycolatopsis TaxID=2618356 RepID=UPI0038FCC36F
MARRPAPVGTIGKINTRTLGRKCVEADGRVRIANGEWKRMRARGTSATEAKNNLTEKLREAAEEATNDEITRDTRIEVLAEMFLDDLETEYRLAKRSPDTVRQWRGYVKNWLTPEFGKLQAREFEKVARRCDQLVKRCMETRSYDAAKSLRTVGIKLGEFGIKYGALTSNPFLGIKLRRAEKRRIRALSAEQRVDVVAKLADNARKRSVDSKGRSLGDRARIWWMLPLLMQAVLSTGVRIGELLALTAAEVDLAKRQVTIRWHLVRQPGVGIIRMRGRKGNPDAILTLTLPEWSLFVWRLLVQEATDGGPLFRAMRSEWLDPSTVINRLQEALLAIGYGWVTSHVFRKTVARALDEEGVPTNWIADQLGITPAVLEEHYREKGTSNTRTAESMESLDVGTTG